jgi:hypothetical protein
MRMACPLKDDIEIWMTRYNIWPAVRCGKSLSPLSMTFAPSTGDKQP